MKKIWMPLFVIMLAGIAQGATAEDSGLHLKYIGPPIPHAEGLVEFRGHTISPPDQPANFILRCGYLQNHPDPTYEQLVMQDLKSGASTLYQIIDKDLVITLKDPNTSDKRFLLQLFSPKNLNFNRSCFLTPNGVTLSQCINAMPVFTPDAAAMMNKNIANECARGMKYVSTDAENSTFNATSTNLFRNMYRDMVKSLKFE